METLPRYKFQAHISFPVVLHQGPILANSGSLVSLSETLWDRAGTANRLEIEIDRPISNNRYNHQAVRIDLLIEGIFGGGGPLSVGPIRVRGRGHVGAPRAPLP